MPTLQTDQTWRFESFRMSVKHSPTVTSRRKKLCTTAHICFGSNHQQKALKKCPGKMEENPFQQTPQNPKMFRFSSTVLSPNCSSLWAKSKISSALMLPSTKRLEAVVLCRAQGDSECSDWPGEMQKKSPPIQMSPPRTPVSENNCYINTKQTRTSPERSSLYLFGARKPPE